MKKNFKCGFMLAETLIVTTFVSGVLIFLFIQFTSLSKGYDNSYIYNTVEGLYSLKNIRDYVKSDSDVINKIHDEVKYETYIDLTDCSLFQDKKYCSLLFKLENINKIYITANSFDIKIFDSNNEDFKKFIYKINSEGKEKYRILAQFNDSTFATIRFGD